MNTSVRTVMMNSLNVLKEFSFDSVLMKRVPAMLKKSLDIQIQCLEELIENFMEVCADRADSVVTNVNVMINALTSIRHALKAAYADEVIEDAPKMNWSSFVVNPLAVH